MKSPDLEHLLEQFQSPLLRYATSFLRDSNAAEDVVQETFLRLIRKPPATGNDDELRNWLFHVCRNLSLDRRKMDIRETKRQEHSMPPPVAATPAQLASRA
ncbi:MAG: RNA polymerase sigma factor, partial [Planctomycetes bacterium]|nr:RNA polymerase sigma factor [Planctomycetota bacterium]